MEGRRLPLALAAAACALALSACGGASDNEAPAESSPTPAVQDSPTVPAEGTDQAPADGEATSDADGPVDGKASTGAGEDEATSDAGADVPDGLDWALEDLNGGQVVGAELAGRDVVLWFWAPW